MRIICRVRKQGKSEDERTVANLAILGAGPIGLEAALAAADAGLAFTVYERGPGVGDHVRQWGHVCLFTPWDLSVSPRMVRHLSDAGMEVPSGPACPTGDELVRRLLEPLVGLPELAPHIRLGTRVDAVGRQGLLKHEEIATPARGSRPFRLLLTGPDGTEEEATAGVVLDCTGVYGRPNCLGDGGIPAPGERTLSGRIDRHLPNLRAQAREWGGSSVLLVGAGASAQTAARGLAELARQAPGTQVTWVVRSPEPTWGAVVDDPLAARAELVDQARRLAAGASPAVHARLGVTVGRLDPGNGHIRAVLTGNGVGGAEEVTVDRVLALAGYVGDNHLYRQLQVHECYATDAPIQLSAALLGAAGGDCLDQVSHGIDVLRNPEPNFFILGAKSYGRNNQFLLRVGWDQVSEVIGDLVSVGGASADDRSVSETATQQP